MLKVCLGCGSKPLPDFDNYDFDPLESGVHFIDCNKRLPFESDSVDEVLCEHMIEHLDKPYEFAQELWRVCKNGAKVVIESPHSSNQIAAGMLFHKTPGINLYSFALFDGKPKTFPTPTERFDIVSFKYIGFPKGKFGWFVKPQEFLFNLCPVFTELFLCKWFPIWSFRVELKVVK